MIKNSKILVTGAAGFVGSNLVRVLAKNGNVVRCLIYPEEKTNRLDGLDVPRLYGDITRKETLEAAVDGVDYIFHLAAKLGGNDNDAFYKVNVEGTQNLVEMCREKGVRLKRFLFVSSTAVIGPSSKNRHRKEEAQCTPISHYGRSKLMVEQYLESLGDKFPSTTVRLPLVYGPGSRGGLHLFFSLLDKRIRPYFGGGASNVCHVYDVVNGMIAAAQSPRAVGNNYILSDNNVYTQRQLLDTINRATGKRALWLFLPYPVLYAFAALCEGFAKINRTGRKLITRNELKSYLKHRYWGYETGKAARDFDFSPQVSLEDGIHLTYEWYKKNNYI